MLLHISIISILKKKLLSSRANELFLKRLTSLYSLIFRNEAKKRIIYGYALASYIPLKLYLTTSFESIRLDPNLFKRTIRFIFPTIYRHSIKVHGGHIDTPKGYKRAETSAASILRVMQGWWNHLFDRREIWITNTRSIIE